MGRRERLPGLGVSLTTPCRPSPLSRGRGRGPSGRALIVALAQEERTRAKPPFPAGRLLSARSARQLTPATALCSSPGAVRWGGRRRIDGGGGLLCIESGWSARVERAAASGSSRRTCLCVVAFLLPGGGGRRRREDVFLCVAPPAVGAAKRRDHGPAARSRALRFSSVTPHPRSSAAARRRPRRHREPLAPTTTRGSTPTTFGQRLTRVEASTFPLMQRLR